jgi:hypothetical protein
VAHTDSLSRKIAGAQVSETSLGNKVRPHL